MTPARLAGTALRLRYGRGIEHPKSEYCKTNARERGMKRIGKKGLYEEDNELSHSEDGGPRVNKFRVSVMRIYKTSLGGTSLVPEHRFILLKFCT